ncbi:MAG TPA: DUF1127 domain-containing protein [Rhizobiaceae bacterium]|nr:DUF1127 domain-containing protein [Rhizobiaceae bacterium]
MTTLDHHSSLHAAPRQAWAARAVNSVAGFYRSWKNRREFMRLGEMTDAELADIGLRRTDLYAAVGLPFGADPTTRLNDIVHRRHENVASRQAQ